MKRTFAALLFSLLAAGGVLAVAPAGPAYFDVVIACAHGCPGTP